MHDNLIHRSTEAHHPVVRVVYEEATVIRYMIAAASLKALSATAPTRGFYRRVIGNVFGARSRGAAAPSPAYINRSRLLIQLCRKYRALGESSAALEVGTGWIHFFSIALRSIFDVRITMVDAWDNRQFSALQRQLARIEPVFRKTFEGGPAEIERGVRVLEAVHAARSFEELYATLGLEYVLDSTLDSVPDASYDLVFSFHTLEHVTNDLVRRHLANMHRVLKPGGLQIHQIGLDDHLSHYDPKAHSKQFLKYSERTWTLFFQNRLQFINRLQCSEWQRLFADSGMTLLETSTVKVDLTDVTIHPDFARFNRDDLACVFATFVLRKEQPSSEGSQGRQEPQQPNGTS